MILPHPDILHNDSIPHELPADIHDVADRPADAPLPHDGSDGGDGGPEEDAEGEAGPEQHGARQPAQQLDDEDEDEDEEAEHDEVRAIVQRARQAVERGPEDGPHGVGGAAGEGGGLLLEGLEARVGAQDMVVYELEESLGEIICFRGFGRAE